VLCKLAVAATLIGTLGGCASVVSDKTQPVKVETLDQAGNAITGAKCDLQNDRGAFHVETPNTVFVRKSSGELIVTCTAPGQPQADGKLISRTGGAVFGNILLGGIIGAVVDTASGVAFNYPEWVQLVFGKTLTFDRNNHKDAQPTVATVLEGEQATEIAKATATPDAQVAQPQKVEHITIVAPPTEADTATLEQGAAQDKS